VNGQAVVDQLCGQQPAEIVGCECAGVALEQERQRITHPPGTTTDLSKSVPSSSRSTGRLSTHAGYSVVVHGRDPHRGAEVVEAVDKAGGTARFVAADLTDVQEVARLAAQAGEVNVLVNNGGFAWFGPTSDLDVDSYDGMFDANVRAAYFLVAALAPGMVRRGSGSIINLGSMVGTLGVAGGAAYSATKAALAALTRAWAAEFSPSGVRVNTVAPGPVYTSGATPDRTTSTGKATLLGRAAESAEIADTIAFLASPKAGYITGAVIAVDGGRTAV
jgi:NAD(P)-dependent dehydrogenase (short-subunit alcohol dehydrogenase family)